MNHRLLGRGTMAVKVCEEGGREEGGRRKEPSNKYEPFHSMALLSELGFFGGVSLWGNRLSISISTGGPILSIYYRVESITVGRSDAL